MFKKIFGEDANSMKSTVEKIHLSILKVANQRDLALEKIDSLKDQRSKELIAAIDNENFDGKGKTRKQILELQEELSELESVGQELLTRKRQAIKAYYAKAAEEAEGEATKSMVQKTEIENRINALKVKYEADLQALTIKRQNLEYQVHSKRDLASRFAKKDFQKEFVLEDDNEKGVEIAATDPFFSVLPWVWEAALNELENRKQNAVTAEREKNPFADTTENYVTRTTRKIILDNKGGIAGLDCSVNSCHIYNIKARTVDSPPPIDPARQPEHRTIDLN